MEACAAAERAHRLAQLRLDERVHDDRGAAAHAVHRELEVFLRLDPRMADLDELLVRELRLERLDEARGCFARGVGDDMQLDRRVRHGGSVSRALLGPIPNPHPPTGMGRYAATCVAGVTTTSQDAETSRGNLQIGRASCRERV